MSTAREKRWRSAIKKYQNPRREVSKSPAKSQKVETLAVFMETEGATATKLLEVANREIVLGYSNPVMCMTTAVVLGGEGLRTVTVTVDTESSYAKEMPDPKYIGPEEALQLLKDFENGPGCKNGQFDESVLITGLRERLDEIAAEA